MSSLFLWYLGGFVLGFFFSVLVLETLDRAASLKLLLLMTVNDCGEGRVGVKTGLVFDTWLKAGERWLNIGSNASKRGRYDTRHWEPVAFIQVKIYET